MESQSASEDVDVTEVLLGVLEGLRGDCGRSSKSSGGGSDGGVGGLSGGLKNLTKNDLITRYRIHPCHWGRHARANSADQAPRL